MFPKQQTCCFSRYTLLGKIEGQPERVCVSTIFLRNVSQHCMPIVHPFTISSNAGFRQTVIQFLIICFQHSHSFLQIYIFIIVYLHCTLTCRLLPRLTLAVNFTKKLPLFYHKHDSQFSIQFITQGRAFQLMVAGRKCLTSVDSPNKIVCVSV